jgi:hypothetical protein
MITVLHKADSRGHAAHGWLESYHTFSFAGYHDPGRVHFGALRVLNDDSVAPGMGFGKHPHDNMEIISIPLEGDLQHEDSTGTKAVIRQGDVQIMSAGTGILHLEKNADSDKHVKFLQIWVFPNQKDVAPRYDQRSFSEEEQHNKLLTVVSPMGNPEGVNIHQDAWFSLGKLDTGVAIEYALHKEGNGVYAFVLDGDITINGITLNRRDGLGISDTSLLTIKSDTTARLLLMEVPMN